MMRGYWRAAAVLLVAGSLRPDVAAAQTGFNGVITFRSTGSGKPDTMIQTTKGNKLRIDGFGSHQGAMIIDKDAKVMMMVEPEKKQYMTMTEDDAKQMAAMMGPMMDKMKQKTPRADPAKYRFANTGKTEIVAGVPCEVWHGEYLGDDEKEEGEACVAKGVGFALADLTYNNPMVMRGGAGQEQFEQYRQLVGGDKGILKVVRLKDGKPHTDLEAIKIERKTVGNEAFQPPPGFKEIRMGDMLMQAQQGMKQMQGRMKPPGEPKDSQVQ